MHSLLADLRYAFRTLARNPGFTIVAVASLALGIGVNIVIFSLVNTALQKPIAGVRAARHRPVAMERERIMVWARWIP